MTSLGFKEMEILLDESLVSLFLSSMKRELSQELLFICFWVRKEDFIRDVIPKML